MNGGREVREDFGSSTHISTVYDVRELHFTDVAVRLPGEAGVLARPPPLPLDGGGEIPRHGARPLWPAYYQDDSWRPGGGAPTGRVLYDDAEGMPTPRPVPPLPSSATRVDRHLHVQFHGTAHHFTAKYRLKLTLNQNKEENCKSDFSLSGRDYSASASRHCSHSGAPKYIIERPRDFRSPTCGQSRSSLGLRALGSIIIASRVAFIAEISTLLIGL